MRSRDVVERRLRTAAYVSSTAAVLSSACLAAVAWARTEAPVPVHWDGSLSPDRYGSKTEGLLVGPLLVLLLAAVFRRVSVAERGRGAAETYVLWVCVMVPLGVLISLTLANTAFGASVGRSPLVLPTLVAVGVMAGWYGIRRVRRMDGAVAPAEPTAGRRYWFTAKRWGWGWSPSSWQGWLVTAVYLALVLARSILGEQWTWLTLVGVFVGTPLVLWLCVQKGETPRWRWGARD